MVAHIKTRPASSLHERSSPGRDLRSVRSKGHHTPSFSTGICRLKRSRPCPVIDEANISHSDIADTVEEQTDVVAATLGKCENAEEGVLEGSCSDKTVSVVRAKGVAWTHKEKRLLYDLRSKGTSYKECSRQLPRRTVGSCRMQWVKHLRDKSPDIWEGAPEEKRRKNSWRRWSSQEDDKLVELVKAGNRWDQCAEQMPGRTKQSCESHWTTRLRSKHPEVSTPMRVKLWTLAEDEELAAHIQDGRDWTWISQQLVGRTAAACGGHWHGDGFGLDARAGLKHTYPNIVYAYAPQERRS